MANNSNINIECISIQPYGPDSRLAHEHPCLQLFDGRSEFVRNNIRRLAVAVFLTNRKTDRAGQPAAASASFKAVLVNDTTGDIVSFRTFSVRFEKGEDKDAIRIDLPLRADMVHERYAYRLHVQDYRSGETLSSAALRFREDCRPSVEGAWLTKGNVFPRFSRLAPREGTRIFFNISPSSIPEGSPAKLPEMMVSVEAADGFRSTLKTTVLVLRSVIMVYCSLGEEEICHGPLTASLECLGRRIYRCPVLFDEDSEVHGRFDPNGCEISFEEDFSQVCDEESAVTEDEDELARRIDILVQKHLMPSEESASNPGTEEQAPDEPSAMDSLNALVGLEKVKAGIGRLYATAGFRRLRIEAGLPVVSQPLHSLFLGAPGTGKTTVAGIMGRLLKEAGVLSRGHVVVRERSMLVGRYYGDEEKATRAALEEAEGGILFIDEAYQLCPPDDPKDPARLVLETMMTALADPERRDWMLIMAGYTAPMLKMLDVNPGLRSRIPATNHYVFDDYGPDQLEAIADKYMADNDFAISDDARLLLRNVLGKAYRDRDECFGNARFVMNLLETGILPAMAERVIRMQHPDRTALRTILPADIPSAASIVRTAERRRSIGFAV